MCTLDSIEFRSILLRTSSGPFGNPPVPRWTDEHWFKRMPAAVSNCQVMISVQFGNLWSTYLNMKHDNSIYLFSRKRKAYCLDALWKASNYKPKAKVETSENSRQFNMLEQLWKSWIENVTSSIPRYKVKGEGSVHLPSVLTNVIHTTKKLHQWFQLF